MPQKQSRSTPLAILPLIAAFFSALILLASCAKAPQRTTGQTPSNRPTIVASSTLAPAMFQDFRPGWEKNTSQDGLWKIAGVWIGTGKNTLDPANVFFTDNEPGETAHGFLHLVSKANATHGSELQTNSAGPLYHYGYYEVRMKLTGVGDPAANRGVCASFFWKREKYARAEWDIEFLTNGPWIHSADHGQVTMNCHLDDGRSKVYYQDLPFNPSKGFHRYGFLWQPTRLDWTVDGKIVHSFVDPGVASEPGYIMMNSWTGSKNWGGLAPTEDTDTVYDWVKFYPNVTSVPNNGQ